MSPLTGSSSIKVFFLVPMLSGFQFSFRISTIVLQQHFLLTFDTGIPQASIKQCSALGCLYAKNIPEKA